MAEAARRLCISFSGGETSAYMTWLILNSPLRDAYDEVAVVFANTGQELDETLEFVQRCDEAFGFGVVWVESVIHHNQRRGPSAKVVSYETASRMHDADGPFEQMIKKYGIPNSKFKHCTRSLKQVPIEAYLRDVRGWGRDYDLAIGIRGDEVDRVSPRAQERRIKYPLVSPYPTTKPQVNAWWEAQPFRLRIKGYQGNCAWCWKKSMRKLITIYRETPDVFDFPRRMETEYGLTGPEFQKGTPEMEALLSAGYRRAFFRGGATTNDIAAESTRLGDTFVPAADDRTQFEDMTEFTGLDWSGECVDSCEPFGEDQ